MEKEGKRMPTTPSTVLFTNFGRVSVPDQETARQTHNATAGNPQGVAAAQSLGDLSHLVFIPTAGWSGELMFIDQWMNPEGLQQFFADPQVQAGAGALFTSYEPIVWRQAPEFASYHISTPLGQHDRFVGMLRGVTSSLEQASALMDATWHPRVLAAHRQGLVSHEVFVRLAAPGSPEALEILAMDTWINHAGMDALYDDASFIQGFDGMFTGEPKTWTLQRPSGEWIEW
jgi:hypothetical protein